MDRPPLTRSLIVLALCALLAPRVTPGVVVVALDGSGDTTGVQAGIDLAAPGDIVLLRQGNYQPLGPLDPDVLITIEKPLTVVGEGTGAILGFVRVRNLDRGESVVLRNLRISMPTLAGYFFPGTEVLDCAGPVLLEDCTTTGALGTGVTDAQPGLAVTNCPGGVSLARCTARGGLGYSTGLVFMIPPSAGGSGVAVTDAKLALDGCTVLGGVGGTDTLFGGGGAPGGAGVVAISSTVFIGGGTTTGGAGGNLCPPAAATDCRGGDGLVQSGGGATLRTVGATFAGGAGGTLSDASPAPDGQPLVIAAGWHLAYTEAARGTVSPVVVREGEAGAISVLGPPGEGARLFVAAAPLHAQLAGKKGVYHLADPVIGPIVLGSIDGTGQFDVPFVAPDLLGFEGVTVLLQGYTHGAEGLMLGNASAMVIVDAAL